MSAASTAREPIADRFAAWLAREDESDALPRFRRLFAAIWLLYDLTDLAIGATEHSRIWTPHARDPVLMAVQVGLIVAGIQLVRGQRVWAFGMLAAGLRLMEAVGYFSLNDYYMVAVVWVVLAHCEGGPFSSDRRPKWVRDVLIFQIAWIYFATAIMKLNPDWLGGGHIFVRTEYLARSLDWPYPHFVRQMFASLAIDSALAAFAVVAELTLAVVLLLRRPYWLGVLLVVGIHMFGTLVTNVWFFSATMIMAVVVLLRAKDATAPLDR